MKTIVLVVLVIAGVIRFGAAQQCGPTPNGVRKCDSGNCCSKFGYCGKTDQYCKDGCQKDYGTCPGNCFPGSARVMTKSGVNQRVSELAIGDQVAVRNHNGDVEYSDVYAHGHFDKDAISEFVVLKLKHQNGNKNVTQTLELTPDHFTIILQGKNQVYKKAKDVRVHDMMLVTMDYIHFTPFTVFDVSRQTLAGLYNPFSLRGNILVNNVLASCHSEWFLDSIFHRLNLVHLLPSIYQGILTPARVLYHSMGRDKYTIVYSNLDSKFGIEKSGVKMNGYLQLLAMAMLPSSAVPINHVKQLDIAKI